MLFSLGVLRHAINQKLRQERMQEVFDQARKIQASILPRRIPVYGGFELYGRIQPMESVGGDFYDYIPITDKILGLAIADVSGHGLPAALQVRDIYMGLRMGMARDFKIVRTVERLNQIIHKSTLTSRFVSMFYGELEPNGVFIYVNAGHPPPFHLSAAGEVRFLDEGGAGPRTARRRDLRARLRAPDPGRHGGALHRRHDRSDAGGGRGRRGVRHRAPGRDRPPPARQELERDRRRR